MTGATQFPYILCADIHFVIFFQAKQQVAAEMGSNDSKTKLLFATEAYGMGVDCPDIRRVIHASAPCTLESKTFTLTTVSY